jgi:hypothetical protein
MTKRPKEWTNDKARIEAVGVGKFFCDDGAARGRSGVSMRKFEENEEYGGIFSDSMLAARWRSLGVKTRKGRKNA